MPYAITTIVSDDTLPARAPLSRRAVATLEDAREYADDRVAHFFYAEQADTGRELPARYFDLSEQARELPESGGTIGPLPDGTVIEVQVIGWHKLAVDGGTLFRSGEQRSPNRRAEIIAAYNARQS